MFNKFKADHQSKPIIIMETMRVIENTKQQKENQNTNQYEIVLEKFHEKALEAEKTLIEIAEPSSITKNVQTFIISFYSLYTAMTLDWTEDKIIQKLDYYAKNLQIPDDLKHFIQLHTQYFNRSSLYFEGLCYKLKIETQLMDELRGRLRCEKYLELEKKNDKQFQVYKIMDTMHIEVIKELVENFKIPVQQKYEYVPQSEKKGLYKMKSIFKLYDHQKQALKKIFLNSAQNQEMNVGHSGVIILPCGAGKTLLGINVALKIKRRTLIICDSVNDVFQWQKSFLNFTNLDKNHILILMRQEQEISQHLLDREDVIVITNSDMMSSQRADMQKVRKIIWYLLIMDEVHGLPAQKIGEEFSKIKTYMKIGLTATPYRQDNKIKEIFYKIGPKLHESMIVDLTLLGFVSKIYCIQVQVKMSQEYEKEYNSYQAKGQQQLMNCLYQMNPKKFQVLQELINLHRGRNDKILIFCEKINILRKTGQLQEFARLNMCPIVSQDVDQAERQAIYKLYQEDKLDTIIFGQIADQGLDLPSANVGIQISFNFKSVRQEFQRMGRIQRKKENTTGEYDCFFYTLVSKNTREVEIQFERQISVINQGYPYELISEDAIIGKQEPSQKLKTILNELQQKIIEVLRSKGISTELSDQD